MTRKLSITLPDDVAEHLDHVDNASAYIAEAIRRSQRGERLAATWERHSLAVTPDGVRRRRAQLESLESRRKVRLLAEATGE